MELLYYCACRYIFTSSTTTIVFCQSTEINYCNSFGCKVVSLKLRTKFVALNYNTATIIVIVTSMR